MRSRRVWPAEPGEARDTGIEGEGRQRQHRACAPRLDAVMGSACRVLYAGVRVAARLRRSPGRAKKIGLAPKPVAGRININ
jgi:hypothetical protein